MRFEISIRPSRYFSRSLSVKSADAFANAVSLSIAPLTADTAVLFRTEPSCFKPFITVSEIRCVRISFPVVVAELPTSSMPC